MRHGMDYKPTELHGVRAVAVLCGNALEVYVLGNLQGAMERGHLKFFGDSEARRALRMEKTLGLYQLDLQRIEAPPRNDPSAGRT